MSGFPTTQPSDRRFQKGKQVVGIVPELPTTRPEPHFQLDSPKCCFQIRCFVFSTTLKEYPVATAAFLSLSPTNFSRTKVLRRHVSTIGH